LSSSIPTIFDRSEWERMLSPIVSLSDSRHLHLLVFDELMRPIDDIVVSNEYNANDSAMAGTEYLDYAPSDQRLINIHDIASGMVINHESLFKNEPIEKTAIYNDFLAVHNSQRQALSHVKMNSGLTIILGVMRERRQGEYSQDELAQIQSCLPLVENIVSLNSQLASHKLLGGSYERLLSQKGVGVLLLDKTMGIIECNDVASELIAKTNSLCIQKNKLVAEGSTNQKKLASTFLNKHQVNTPLILENKDGLSFLTMTVHALDHMAMSEAALKADYLILLSSTKESFMQQQFAANFDLTAAETRLVNLLYSGCSLQQIATRASVSMNTVRWTLKNVFAKTNSHSQVQLLRLINQYTV